MKNALHSNGSDGQGIRTTISGRSYRLAEEWSCRFVERLWYISGNVPIRAWQICCKKHPERRACGIPMISLQSDKYACLLTAKSLSCNCVLHLWERCGRTIHCRMQQASGLSYFHTHNPNLPPIFRKSVFPVKIRKENNSLSWKRKNLPADGEVFIRSRPSAVLRKSRFHANMESVIGDFTVVFNRIESSYIFRR